MQSSEGKRRREDTEGSNEAGGRVCSDAEEDQTLRPAKSPGLLVRRLDSKRQL